MSEELIISQCSPTMAGLKTGALFTCPLENKKTLTESVRAMNVRLVPRGVRMLPLKVTKNKALIYMYRPVRLKADLQDKTAQRILLARNYPLENVDRCIIELIHKLNQSDAFPHEIGLFLGYPPEDVEAFIRNDAKHAKCVGTWKVYGDEAAAKQKFAQYQKCTRVYGEAFRRHKSFDRLVVSCL